MSDLYSLYELMPTAIKVKEEKKANTSIVRFETSTSPSWKDIKIFIRHHFFKHYHNRKNLFNDYKFRRIATLNITRQIINNFNPFEEKYFNKNSIAINEDTNVVASPKTRGKKLNEEKSSKE